MKYSSASAFEKHLREASPCHFSSVYGIFIKDDFERKEAVRRALQILGQILGNPCSTYYGERLNHKELLTDLNSFPLFSEVQLVVLHQVDKVGKHAFNAIMTYLENPNPKAIFIFTASNSMRSSGFYQKAEKAGVLLEMEEVKPWEKEREAQSKIASRAAASGKTFSSQAVQILIQHVGTDFAFLSQEIDKLCCFVGERKEIGPQDVSALVAGINIGTIWQLGDAIFKKNITASLTIAKALFQEGASLIALLKQLRAHLREEGIETMVSDLEAVLLCNQKLKFFEAMQVLKLPVVETVVSLKDLQSERVVVKENEGAGAKQMEMNLLPREAAAFAQQLSYPIYQPYIRGPEYTVDLYLNQKGKVHGAVVRLRELVVDGESQITRTVNIPEIEQLCREAAEALHLVGHVLFQVIQSEENGNYYLLECNPRFGGASTLSIAAGLDSFLWFFQETMQQPCAPFQLCDHPLRQVRYPKDKVSFL